MSPGRPAPKCVKNFIREYIEEHGDVGSAEISEMMIPKLRKSAVSPRSVGQIRKYLNTPQEMESLHDAEETNTDDMDEGTV